MFSKAEKSRFLIVIVLIAFLLILYLVADVFSQRADLGQINSFEECVAAGNPVMESFPRQCRTEDGRLFVEEIDEPIEVPGEGEDDRENDRENDRDEDEVSGRTPGAYDGCVITGCSGQVCAGEGVVTTCEFRAEYACYDSAVCERQASGECGWTETSELESCLARF